MNTFPKTYTDCCHILSIDESKRLETVSWFYDISKIVNQDEKLKYESALNHLNRLLICRDAYWKILGDWQPNWDDSSVKFTIRTHKDELILSSTVLLNATFVFPTEEVRNMFYENFKDEINYCKYLI